MKLLAAALLILSQGAFAQSTDNFVLNQPTQAIHLEQKEFETIYRTDQVPDTCYRTEIQGTTTQCHTEYDRSCSTDYRQECFNQSYPVCHSVPRRSCSNRQVCSNTNDRVCNSHGCVNVPRRSCHTEQSCSTQNDSVCHNESRRECRTVPYSSCQNIPRQVCQQVPNQVQVPYACTRPVQVPVGQQLKLDTKAVLNVTLQNFAETGQIADSFTANLNSGIVTTRLTTPSSQYLYQVLAQNRAEQVISSTEKLVTYTLLIKATSIQKLNSFLSLQISQPALYFNRLEFSLSGQINVPFKGHFKLIQRRAIGANLEIIDDDFKSNAIVSQGAKNTLMLNSFGVTELRSKLHYITLDLGIDIDALKQNLINPEAINLIKNQGQPITSDTEGYPAN